jgi:hypothetical protein
MIIFGVLAMIPKHAAPFGYVGIRGCDYASFAIGSQVLGEIETEATSVPQ